METSIPPSSVKCAFEARIPPQGFAHILRGPLSLHGKIRRRGFAALSGPLRKIRKASPSPRLGSRGSPSPLIEHVAERLREEKFV